MDFAEELKLFSTRIMKIKDKIQTEEAVKTSIVLPFFHILGYDFLIQKNLFQNIPRM
ncbi:hypothetical protein [Clostridium sp.]|jgi:hypothetical protein|uniref:hypothetical protein n=1 Tax=Clostridium sp. TaxID=1506 RepID=UPI003EEDDBEF